MIQNDAEKEWMLPLLELRNELDVENDRPLRDFRRMSGAVQLFHDRIIPGPYKQASRERWLRKLLEAQRWIRKNGGPAVAKLELITVEELQEIRRLWVIEKHEFEDNLPRIYEEVLGEPYPAPPIDEHLPLDNESLALLREVCGEDELHFQLVRELLDVERRHQFMARRAGLFDALESAIERGFFSSEDDALQRARERESALRLRPDTPQEHEDRPLAEPPARSGRTLTLFEDADDYVRVLPPSAVPQRG
jgi:DNA sulfur modification protein DndC